MTTWLITGCSTGIGRHLAQVVLARGWNAIVTARSLATIQDIVEPHPNSSIALPLDVTDREQIVAAVRQGEARFGAVDVLVNNAGHGYRAAVEEADTADVEELFATNLFGPVALIKAVLPGMRQRRHGVIVNVSSIAARRTAPGSGYYSATKCALEGLSDGLRKEVAPLGVKVMVVEPGAFRTDFSGRSLTQSRTAMPDYTETAGRRRKENDKTDGNQPGDPARGAEVIIKAVEASDSPFRLLLGSDAVEVVRAELDAQRAELEKWKAISVTTDLPS
jgi:NAD(P)-dependent dehydrogenase (short-subunit alcohol dehydrogenase family)